ncbi:hypothetical protein ACOMHN_045058 [Nucella lapillus]
MLGTSDVHLRNLIAHYPDQQSFQNVELFSYRRQSPPVLDHRFLPPSPSPQRFPLYHPPQPRHHHHDHHHHHHHDDHHPYHQHQHPEYDHQLEEDVPPQPAPPLWQRQQVANTSGCSTFMLTGAALFSGAVSLVTLALAVSTDFWLLMREPYRVPAEELARWNLTGPVETNVMVNLRSGLWNVCTMNLMSGNVTEKVTDVKNDVAKVSKEEEYKVEQTGSRGGW